MSRLALLVLPKASFCLIRKSLGVKPRTAIRAPVRLRSINDRPYPPDYIRCMQFKDLSYWSIFKLGLIFEAVIPLISSPFLLALYFYMPNAFSWDIEKPVLGPTLTTDSWGNKIGFILVGVLISLIVQSVIWYFLAQKTPLGRVRISRPQVTTTL